MAIMNTYNYTKPKGFVRKEAPKLSVQPKKKTENKTDSYLEAKVLSAKPEELTYMLYEGLVKFIRKAVMAVEQKQYEQANDYTKRAQNIVLELRNTLNMEISLSQSLDDLYEYVDYKLLQANMTKDIQQFEDALEIADEFRLTWKQAFHL